MRTYDHVFQSTRNLSENLDAFLGLLVAPALMVTAAGLLQLEKVIKWEDTVQMQNTSKIRCRPENVTPTKTVIRRGLAVEIHPEDAR